MISVCVKGKPSYMVLKSTLTYFVEKRANSLLKLTLEQEDAGNDLTSSKSELLFFKIYSSSYVPFSIR